MVDKIMEDIVEQGGINTASPPIEEQNKVNKKQACKYRKSCYETGIKPVVDDNSIFNFRHWWPEKNGGDKDKEDEVKLYNENENLPLLKLRCKYRRSCYQEHGIPFKDKFEEERKKPVLAYKTVPLQHGKKKTLKEIAAEALKKVEESIEKAAKRPLVKIVEKQMTAMEEKLSEKLHCKYRKSCYETGEIPHIEENWSLPLPIKIFSTESVDSENNQINFDELEQLEKKLYCKYRKSCYETGVKPDVEPEIFINTLKDLTTIYQQVETRKPSLQEKCKYRKSCYETGIVPDINPKLEAVISKEVSSVIPTNTQDLRLLCKYRKSCYAEVHSSATVETIKLLRKRRQIEKELRRRKAARMKPHRKLRGEVQLGHHRKAVGKKTLDESIDDVKERNVKPLKISDKRKARKQEEGEQEEDVEIKERPDSESKKGKVKKSKPQIKQSDQPLATKSKEASPVKKERKGKKVKLEKEASTATPTMGSKEETDVTDFSKKEAKPAIPSPLKTELHVPEEQDTERESIGDDKKGKRFGKAVQTMSKLIEEMQQQQEQQKRKEFCKYRKSCYETGKRPEIKQSFYNLLEMFKDHVDRETDEAHVKPKTETEKKLDCKYRKTCYRTGEYPGTHEVKSGEVKSIHLDTKASHSIKAEEGFKYDAKSNDSARISPKEPRFHTEQQTQSDSVNMIGLERYKRSGKCSPYYYSCREILGLPPKERAPIGPNGRRLCRKKPLSSA
ncbi:unnamed protein product [Angiostrongylus costaricensis]|uniref:AT-rich interactive domain-containing protein 5B n=1 Tax=Angiostrongylus costaricensis TaxID=334426 RepID=A0A0R3PAB8_ANGCS|nr:unnamed protein product [Angiostrongylus costaricensis]